MEKQWAHYGKNEVSANVKRPAAHWESLGFLAGPSLAHIPALSDPKKDLN